MFLIIRFIQNATDIYSMILVAFALLSWFPNAYNTQLGKFLETLCKPILEPLKRLPLQIAGFLGLDSSNSLAHDKSLSHQFVGCLMSKDLYQHFATEDIPFIDKSLEWMRQVEEHYAPILTPFINPHQVYILETLGNNREIKTFSSTSYVPSEYARVLLAPDYFAPSLEDFEMALLEIEYSSKFQQLTHSKILGTVLNRLGIDRKYYLVPGWYSKNFQVACKFSRTFFFRYYKIERWLSRKRGLGFKPSLG